MEFITPVAAGCAARSKSASHQNGFPAPSGRPPGDSWPEGHVILTVSTGPQPEVGVQQARSALAKNRLKWVCLFVCLLAYPTLPPPR